MKTVLLSLITASLLFTTLGAEENIAPKDPKAWAQWVEKRHPITDAHGHGPDIGSGEWMGALDKKLGITDKDGHGPDIGSEEWRSAVEKKLKSGKRELLSSHSTIARFDGLKDHRCMGRTALCPDECGHSGKLASFKIIKYLAYEKPGEFGDPKQEQFQILIQDNKDNAKVAENILTAIRALKPGDEVKLDWNHDFVTKDGASSPERPITKIEKIE
jgi:hypothetical protein